MQYILFSISLVNLLIITALIWYEFKKTHAIFSPEKIYLFNTSITALSLLYLSTNIEYLIEISSKSHYAAGYTDQYYNVFIITVISSLSYYFFIKLSYNIRLNLLQNLLSSIAAKISIDLSKNNKNIKYSSLLILTFGIILFFYALESAGGVIYLIQNQMKRVELLAGLGYEFKTSTTLIQIGVFLLFFLFITKKPFISYSILIASSILIATLGSRGLIVNFILIVTITYYYKIKNFEIFKLKYLLLGPTVIFLFLGIGQLRERDGYEMLISNPVNFALESLNKAGMYIVQYGSDVYRDYIILNHFDENDYWYGKTYLSLAYAAIPRSIFKDKPPIDTGMYIVAIDSGYKVDPPMPSDNLAGWGLPEGNMAGYSNFGIIGLLFLNFLSAAISVTLYKQIFKSKLGIFSLYLYASICLSGIVDLSPAGILSIIINFITVFIVSRIIKISTIKFKNEL